MAPPRISDTPDWAREYTAEDEARLTRNLLALEQEVHEALGDPDEPLTPELLSRFHRLLFDGVREHRGRIRRKGYGAEKLTFGPNISTHRDAVERELLALFAPARRELEDLQRNSDSPDYETAAIWLAVRLHAEVIRIHPFEDGNGRSSRALMDWVLVRLGLRPIPIEACKQEYVDALNSYFHKRDAKVLLDLFLRLYPL